MNDHLRRHVVIVEPYSSGALLAERFKKRGFLCVAVHLRPLVGKLASSFRSDDFVESIVYDGDFAGLIDQLAPFQVVAAVPGQEAGVILADRLSQHLDAPHNDPALSLARRDKYVMHQAIANAGLRSMEQIKTADFARMAQWLEQRNIWPVVVKPPLSGGTDGVVVCDDIAAARQAFEDRIKQTNLLGFCNDEMIAQEMIAGTEFVVDAVSSGGHHVVVSLSWYRKERSPEGGPIYRGMMFVPTEEWHNHQLVIDYTLATLDALGITVGPSHTEVFMDESGPVLVESGARLCGAMVPLYLEEIATVSPLDLAITAYVDPTAFAELAAQPTRHHSQLQVYMMANRRAGRLVGYPGDAPIRNLATVRDIYWYAALDAQVVPTRDLLSSLGLVFLISENRSVLAADVAYIAQLESADKLIALDSDQPIAAMA